MSRTSHCFNVTGIDHMPRATHYIDDIIAIIKTLIAKGYAYPAGGDVYFDVTKDEDYGKLCHRDPEQLEAGARIEVSDKKRNPGDFALWKSAKPGEPAWESPWGKGRPGWHIECSAMSMKLLGKTLDIHGGGLDLQFPHHENELAQSESCNGVTFVRYWMHNGLMKTGTEKMSKSKGNEIVVAELLKRHDPETLRFFLLSTHYRRPIDYSEERLEEIRRGLGWLLSLLRALSSASPSKAFMSSRHRVNAGRRVLAASIHRSSRKLPACGDDSSSTWTTISTPAAPSASCMKCSPRSTVLRTHSTWKALHRRPTTWKPCGGRHCFLRS